LRRVEQRTNEILADLQRKLERERRSELGLLVDRQAITEPPLMLSFVITTTREFVIATIREEVMRALLLGFLLLVAEPTLAAEKYVGSNVDSRTILAFKVADAAVQKFLPGSWEPDVTTAGPAKDVNLRVTFIDRIVNRDAEGKALDPVRIATLAHRSEMMWPTIPG
jgi:hypothetical protein